MKLVAFQSRFNSTFSEHSPITDPSITANINKDKFVIGIYKRKKHNADDVLVVVEQWATSRWRLDANMFTIQSPYTMWEIPSVFKPRSCLLPFRFCLHNLKDNTRGGKREAYDLRKAFVWNITFICLYKLVLSKVKCLKSKGKWPIMWPLSWCKVVIYAKRV